MITREEIRHLSQLDSPSGCAISFYFQPRTPQDKSHREESILLKDLAREALRNAERNGNHVALREDLQRIMAVAEGLHGNHSRGKVIFACREHGVWRELDVAPRLGHSQLKVNSRFHLKPLVAALSNLRRVCVALVNKQKARLFELREESISQKPDLEFGELPHIGRSDGFSGCHDDAWPELEPHLHSYLKQRLLGRFLVDPVAAPAQEVKDRAEQILAEFTLSEQQALVRQVLGEAQRNARGALGLRHVLTALERQEVQTLVVSRDFKAEAVECSNCRHLDTRMVRDCAVCGQQTRNLSDVADALVDLAIRNGADIQFVDGDPELERAGHVGALLRFRADQNTAGKVAV